MTWKLEPIAGEFTGQDITVDRDMLVGRHQDADIQLSSADISRRHAALLLKADALYVQDLKSSNGTFVNDNRIEHETLLKDGDIVQFASQKFSLLAPVASEKVVAPKVDAVIQQPSEAIAVSETAQAVAEPVVEPVTESVFPPVEQKEPTAAERMNSQGMPDLKERDASVQLNRDGMPQSVGVPKPAPIPAGTDLTSVKPEPQPMPVEKPESIVEQKVEEQKNAKVGLISLIVLIILAVIAWLAFK